MAVVLPVLVHKLLRAVLTAAGNARGAWRLPRLVANVRLLRFPDRPVLTRLKFGEPLWIDPNDSMARYIFYLGAWAPEIAAHFVPTVRAVDVVADVGKVTIRLCAGI